MSYVPFPGYPWRQDRWWPTPEPYWPQPTPHPNIRPRDGMPIRPLPPIGKIDWPQVSQEEIDDLRRRVEQLEQERQHKRPEKVLRPEDV